MHGTVGGDVRDRPCRARAGQALPAGQEPRTADPDQTGPLPSSATGTENRIDLRSS
jgi:hypothetical protein